jgi:hypothetical protein
MRRGAKDWFHKSGLYRAKVISNEDTQNRGRLQVRILQIHPEPGSIPTTLGEVTTSPATVPSESGLVDISPSAPATVSVEGIKAPLDYSTEDKFLPWAEPCFPFGGSPDEGSIMIPPVGAYVWVGFEMGHVGRPIWLGGWYAVGELPVEFSDPTNVRLIKTPGGGLLLFDDTDGVVHIVTSGGAAGTRYIKMDDSSTKIEIDNGGLSKITMDGANITIDCANVTVNASAAAEVNCATATVAASGAVNITAGGAASLVSTGLATVGGANVTVATAGNVILGTGATEGVCLDSLLTIVSDMVTVFDGHTHSGVTPGVGSTGAVSATQVAPTAANASATVLAKA